MTPERVKRLVECYGADPEVWPAEERESAQTLLHGTPVLQRWAAQAVPLDAMLAQGCQAMDNEVSDVQLARLKQRIVEQLPAQNESVAQHRRQYLTWTHHPWWSMAAGMVMAAGLMLMVHLENPQPVTSVQSNLAGDMSFEQWAWEDITGETPINNVDVSNPVQLGLLEMGFAPEEL